MVQNISLNASWQHKLRHMYVMKMASSKVATKFNMLIVRGKSELYAHLWGP